MTASDVPDDADLSSQCTTFIRHDLTYRGCVETHRYDPHFYDGAWRVYFDRNRDLWRSEREILRLLDGEGKTVAVLEY